MTPIKLNNEKLQTLLSNITDEFFQPKVTNLLSDQIYYKRDNLIPGIHSCSDEYFNKARTFNITEYGYPRACYGVSESALNHNVYDSFDDIRKKIKKISTFLGTERLALSMLYPDDGFIGWHHNGNAPGYNILLTYSKDGDGYFKYYDYKTEDFVVLQDKQGWNVRVGYYPDQYKEPDRVFWHCAKTTKQRITIAWVIDHRKMWENLIDDISGGDYNRSDLG